jgi:hypothetical protein
MLAILLGMHCLHDQPPGMLYYCVITFASQQSHDGFGRVDSTPASHLNLRDKAIEPSQDPLTQIVAEARNHAKGGSVFRSGCEGDPSSCCGPCHGTILEKPQGQNVAEEHPHWCGCCGDEILSADSGPCHHQQKVG